MARIGGVNQLALNNTQLANGRANYLLKFPGALYIDRKMPQGSLAATVAVNDTLHNCGTWHLSNMKTTEYWRDVLYPPNTLQDPLV